MFDWDEAVRRYLAGRIAPGPFSTQQVLTFLHDYYKVTFTVEEARVELAKRYRDVGMDFWRVHRTKVE